MRYFEILGAFLKLLSILQKKNEIPEDDPDTIEKSKIKKNKHQRILNRCFTLHVSSYVRNMYEHLTSTFFYQHMRFKLPTQAFSLVV